MCREQTLVPIPQYLKHSVSFDATHPEFGVDDFGQECFRIDSCIVPAITALFTNGVVTRGCCCGHGSGTGVISLVTEEYDAGEPIVEVTCDHIGGRRMVCEKCWSEP